MDKVKSEPVKRLMDDSEDDEPLAAKLVDMMPGAFKILMQIIFSITFQCMPVFSDWNKVPS